MTNKTIATMDVIVNEGKDRNIYPGSSQVEVTRKDIPAFRGGVTMTIQVSELVALEPKINIIVDPEVRGGVPSVGVGNEPISHILEKLSLGTTINMLMDENPQLSLSDIQLALKTASWVMRDPSIDWASLELNDMVAFQDELNFWQSLNSDSLGNISKLEE